MKLLVWNILLFYVVTVKVSRVLGSHEDPLPEVSSSTGGMGSSKGATFGALVREHLSHFIEDLVMSYKVPSLTTEHPVTPTTEQPKVLTSSEPRSIKDDSSSMTNVIATSLTAKQPATDTTTTYTTTEEFEFPTSTEPSYLKDNSSLMIDVIVPIIEDLVNDEVAQENITRLFRMTVEAFLPLAAEVFKASNESYDPDGTSVIKIPRDVFESTFIKLYEESLPLFRTIVRSRLEFALKLLSYNTNALFKTVYEMKRRNGTRFGDIWDKSWGLYVKYANLYWNSTAELVHTYSLVEIQDDIESFLSLFNNDNLQKTWRNNLSVLQDVSGINIESISQLLFDIPGIYDVISTIPAGFYLQMLLLMM